MSAFNFRQSIATRLARVNVLEHAVDSVYAAACPGPETSVPSLWGLCLQVFCVRVQDAFGAGLSVLCAQLYMTVL